MRGKSVIDVSTNSKEIENGIVKMLNKEFKNKIKLEKNPYFQENSLEKAHQVIKNFLFSDEIKKIKMFYDFKIIK